MSTDFITSKKVQFIEVFDGRLGRFGVKEYIHKKSTEERFRCLTDGTNYVWAYASEDGFLSGLTRWGGNAPGQILYAIAEVFDTNIISEYEPQFWGFETWEEMDLALDKAHAEACDRLYAEIINFAKGEPSDLKYGTRENKMANIANKIVAQNRNFLLPEMREKLMAAIDSLYHVKGFFEHLTDAEVASAIEQVSSEVTASS